MSKVVERPRSMSKVLSAKRICFKMYIKKADLIYIADNSLRTQFINVGPRLPDTVVLVANNESRAIEYYDKLIYLTIPVQKDW